MISNVWRWGSAMLLTEAIPSHNLTAIWILNIREVSSIVLTIQYRNDDGTSHKFIK